jgi:hypothetical protein
MPKDKDNLPVKPELAEPPKSVVSAPSTRVTIAFPFSSIQSKETTDEVRELAEIVMGLAAELAEFRPSPGTKALAQRAETLMTKLGH